MTVAGAGIEENQGGTVREEAAMVERWEARVVGLSGGALALSGLLLACGAPAQAQQAPSVGPGGGLDLAVGGFVTFYWLAGDVAERQGGRQSSSDFRNDSEVHVRIQGRDPGSGVVYGAVIALEADTNKNPNADETYVFLRGGFGDVQFGDDDGVLALTSLRLAF